MGLYTEAADIIRKVKAKKASVKTLVLSKSTYPNKKQLYALVCETLKNTDILRKVEEKVCLLQKEAVLEGDENLLHVLLYDQLIGRGIKGAHNLRIAVQRYRSLLKAEYKKLKESHRSSSKTKKLYDKAGCLPRYARVNLLKTTVDDAIHSFCEEGWKLYSTTDEEASDKTFAEIVSQFSADQFMLDPNLPDLLVFPPGTDLHDHKQARSGEIILQDKASCFPAHILSPPEGAVVIDCCAAPGNKTSHIASLMKNSGQIFAFDKDVSRLSTMKTLLTRAGVTSADVQHKDFLLVKPSDLQYKDIGFIVVDPSCSGSGMVNRLNEEIMDSTERLKSLSRFQISILKHALSFPNVQRVVYSTCSIHREENEDVVHEVLQQVAGKFVLKKINPDWPCGEVRGQDSGKEYLRMSPDIDLTNGFFVVCFDRSPEKGNRKESKGVELYNNDELTVGGDDYRKQLKRTKKPVDSDKNCNAVPESNNSIGEEISLISVEDKARKRKKKKKKKEKGEDCLPIEEGENSFVTLEEKEMDAHKRDVKKKTKKHKKGYSSEKVMTLSDNDICEAETTMEKLESSMGSEDGKLRRKKKKHHNEVSENSLEDIVIASANVRKSISVVTENDVHERKRRKHHKRSANYDEESVGISYNQQNVAENKAAASIEDQTGVQRKGLKKKKRKHEKRRPEEVLVTRLADIPHSGSGKQQKLEIQNDRNVESNEASCEPEQSFDELLPRKKHRKQKKDKK